MIICGTGHRPNKLGGYSIENLLLLSKMCANQLKEIDDLDHVISGMALGFDTALASSCVALGIPFTAAVPFRGQEKIWNARDQEMYNILLDKAHKVVILSEDAYHPYLLQKRNEWMVDNSDMVLACWNGSSGGTRNCIRYALAQGKKIMNCYDSFETMKGMK